MGMVKGASDLVLIWGNPLQIGFLELKRKGGTLSDKQREFLDYWQDTPVKTGVGYNFKECKDIIEQWIFIK